MSHHRNTPHAPDYILLLTVLVLVGMGLIFVYSSSFAYALAQFSDAAYYVVRQGLWAILGGLLLLLTARSDYHRLLPWSPWLMLLSLGSLAVILVPGLGVEINGAKRWISMGPLPPVQPSEFLKVALILYVSAWLATRGDRLRQFSTGVIPFVLMVGLVGGLIMLQPDMGTTVVIVLIAITLFFLAGADLRHLLLLVSAAMVAAVPLVLAAAYRSDRIKSFLDPWQDPQGKGFHIIQSLIALGSGGLTGLGMGASRQKFFYVPGSHTDAIYAIIGEELGLIGTLLILGLLALLAYRGFRIAIGAPDAFGALLAAGVTCWFLYQALINIGGITRSIPFTGITLPFVSYGGSSLAANMTGVGLMLSVSRWRVVTEERARHRFLRKLLAWAR